MATFISLLTFTEQGVRNIKDTHKRREAADKLGKSMGVKIREIYYTMGRYDAVTVLEAPDDETASAFALKIGSLGNVRTLTMRAYSADEMKRITSRI